MTRARDLATSAINAFSDADHTHLNNIEANADVTDATNVVAALTAGTNVAIASDGTVSSADTTKLPLTGGTVTGDIDLLQAKHIRWKHAAGGTLRASISAESDDKLQLNTGSSETARMTIDTNGLVGIGIDAPDSPLTVQPSAQGVGTNNVQNWMYSLSNGSEFDLKLKQVVASGLVKYAFDLRNDGDSYADNLVLDRGNVGIGVSTPQCKLDIDVAVDTSLGLRSQSGIIVAQYTGAPAVGNRSQIGLGYGNTYTNVSIGAVRTSAAAYGTDDFIIATKSGTTDTAPTERFRIKANGDTFFNGGNVGIGETSPNSAIHVVGTKSTSGYPSGILSIQDDNAISTAGNGGGLRFSGKYTSAGVITTSGSIETLKDNTNSGEYGFNMNISTRTNGGANRPAIKITSEGIVTKPLQPAFHVTNTAGLTENIAIGSFETINMGTEIYDTTNNFTSNTFTAPATGKYQMNVQLLIGNMDSASSYIVFDCSTSLRNYHYIIYPTTSITADGIQQIMWSFVADMDAGDTAFLRAIQSGGTSQADVMSDSNYNRWTGYLLG